MLAELTLPPHMSSIHRMPYAVYIHSAWHEVTWNYTSSISDCVETLEVCHVVCLQAVKSNAIEYRRCQKVSSSSILQTPVWSKLHISSHRRKILWIDKQRGRSSIKVAKWYQSFWVVSFCYHHHHHLFLRLTDTTKDRNYVWAMSHEFTWQTQGSRKGHQQIWEGPCVCIKMTQGNFLGHRLKWRLRMRKRVQYDITFYLGRSRCWPHGVTNSENVHRLHVSYCRSLDMAHMFVQTPILKGNPRATITRLSQPDTDGGQNEVKSMVTWISTVLGKSIVHIHCTWKKHSAYPA